LQHLRCDWGGMDLPEHDAISVDVARNKTVEIGSAVAG
jgi:hypothetical protein